MIQKPPECALCTLARRGTGFARAKGSSRNGVMMLGEALGRREAQIGEPFVGDAGAQLNRTLQRVQSARDDFRIDNCCRCQPPNNWLDGAPWESNAVSSCSYYTEAEILKTQPKVIVPLGNVAMNYLIGRRGIESKRGYVYRYALRDFRCWVVPTYHPSFIMRGQQKLTEVQSIDIRRALRVARNGYKEPETLYLEFPSKSTISEFVNECEVACNSGKWLAADIETPCSGGVDEDEYGEIMDADIIRISFSFRPGYAITIPWTNENYEAIHKILALNWPYVVFWNQLFDVPRLLSKGCVIGGKILDAMYMWHFLQSDLPKKLGYVATFFTDMEEWKSMSDTHPEYYSCKDADATIQCALAITKLLVDQNRLEFFLRHYVSLQPKVETMAASGVLIDKVQQEKFRGEVDKELERIDDEIQSAVPRGVRPFKPRRKVPGDAYIGGPTEKAAQGECWDYDDNGEWGIRLPFLYNSPKQVIGYMRAQRHPVPRNYKTGKDTTGAADLEKLAEQYPDDPLYPRILNAREFRKVKGQYIDGYEPGPDGRVRTHFNRKPSTWRFNADNPNVQNVLKRSHLAKEYRKQFIAADGCVLVELDYKALEAQLTGFYAGDPDYIRAAKLGVHSILMSHVLGRPINLALPTREIKRITKELKASDALLYDACKHVVHMSNYGARPRRIRIEFPEHFESVRRATELQDLYFSTIAKKVKRWQQETLQHAFNDHYLQNVYGYRHYFHDVLHYIGGGALEWGTDAKRALAFLPQSTGAGLLCEALINISARPEIFKMLRWIIHDSIVAEVPKDQLVEAVTFMRGAMEAPQPLLSGLSVEVEIQMNTNWGEMADYETNTALISV